MTGYIITPRHFLTDIFKMFIYIGLVQYIVWILCGCNVVARPGVLRYNYNVMYICMYRISLFGFGMCFGLYFFSILSISIMFTVNVCAVWCFQNKVPICRQQQINNKKKETCKRFLHVWQKNEDSLLGSGVVVMR